MQTSESTQRNVSWVGSLGVHVGFALLLMLLMKDCGTGGGDGTQYMSLNVAALGDSDTGGGDSNDASSQSASSSSEPVQEEAVETQETAPVSAPKPDPKPNTTKPTTTPSTKPNPTVSNPLNNALDALNNNGKETGQGPKDDGKKEGVENGSVNGKGLFNGGGGNGEWALAGRSMTANPSLDEKPQEEGKVVVDIIVDKNGKVVSATVNTAKSSTSASGAAKLYELAIKAAKSARFSTNASATTNQKGSITIFFKLK
jgi:TonB family protein